MRTKRLLNLTKVGVEAVDLTRRLRLMGGSRVLAIMMARIVVACYGGPDASRREALSTKLTSPAGEGFIRSRARRGNRRLQNGLLLIFVGALLAGCADRPDTSYYAAVLDELAIPASWELVHTTIQEPGGTDTGVDPSRPIDTISCSGLFGQCPAIARYFLGEGRPTDAYAAAKQLLVSAGFDVQSDSGPACDKPPGSAACFFRGVRGSDLVHVSVERPGEDPNGVAAADLDHSVVIIKAQHK